MPRALLWAIAAACLCAATWAADEPRPVFVYGTSEAVTKESVRIVGRGANPVTVTLTTAANTKVGVATYAKAEDVAKDMVVAVLPAKEANAPAKGLAICAPEAGLTGAEALVSALTWRLGFLTSRGAPPKDAPQPQLGVITALETGKLTIKLKDETITVVTNDKTMAIKVKEAKDATALVQGGRSLGQYLDKDKVAKVLLKMPDPQPR